MTGLLKWLSLQRDPERRSGEEYPLRLESDDDAVKIVTIHKSKGLEYPIVFCPFMWGGSRLRKTKTSFLFHNADRNGALTLDLGSPEAPENRKDAERELLAENLRLLYVALTRARNRCYLVWGRIKGAGTSAPAYIFHPTQYGEDVLDAMEEKFRRLTDRAVNDRLKAIQQRAPEAISLREIQDTLTADHIATTDRKPLLSYRTFSGQIIPNSRISSFSSLVSTQLHSAELADHDAALLSSMPEQPRFETDLARKNERDISSFPRGAKSGLFVHDVFEHLDFAEQDPRVIDHLIAEKLAQYGFEQGWQDSVCRMVCNVLSVQLNGLPSRMRFSHIGMQDRLNELEFYFPLKAISPLRLRSLFTRDDNVSLPAGFPEQIGRLSFSKTEGYMKGFVDMVFRYDDRFFIVDWKSNWLGPRSEEYDQKTLSRAMTQHYYHLQYYIYTMAIHRYLAHRITDYDYDTHFGGIFYVFVRGVNPALGPQYGIYAARPSKAHINDLCDRLLKVSPERGQQ
jgi:exodeoxyribonuclease V beta subunit